MRFRAELQLDGKTATGITVPAEVLAGLGGGKTRGAGDDQRAHIPQHDRDDERGREDPGSAAPSALRGTSMPETSWTSRSRRIPRRVPPLCQTIFPRKTNSARRGMRESRYSNDDR
jgi:hypothetical protein